MKKLFFLLPLLATVLVVAGCTKPKQAEQITLNYWGVNEPAENYQEVIRDFQAANPNITINYTRKGLKEYRQQVVARAGQDNGPDIFRFHNSWIPAVKPILAITPDSVQKDLDYLKTFYPVVHTDLIANRGYYGIPLMYDGLGLYYNKQLFRQRGLSEPPQAWNDVLDVALQLKADNQGKLEVGGIAMGSTQNVDYWGDIIALLMYQENASLSAPASTREQTETALNYYHEFITKHKVWSESMVNSTDAFAQGKLAMMFGTSWTAFEVQIKNPQLEFAVAPVPQVPGTKLGIANYWVEGVVNTIKPSKQEAAWKFLSYLASKETQQRLYAIQGKTRLFGEPPSRTDLAGDVRSNQYLNGILETAPSARSTYLSSKTFGGGFNDEISSQYEKLLNQGNFAQTAKEIETLHSKYGLVQ